MRTVPRIASLVPSGTDLVAALGLSEGLVGVSHECDHPAARGKPALTASRVIPPAEHLSAAEIDDRVRDAAGRGEALYEVDRDTLQQLAPDVVISQTICDVCAVDGDQVELRNDAQLVNLTATSLNGLFADVMRVGQSCDREHSALEVIESVRARLDAVADSVDDRDPVAALALEWTAPPYVGGHWVPELFSVAGAEHVDGRPGEASRRVEWEEVIEADPEVLVVLPCGYGLDAAVSEAAQLAPDLAQVRAVREGRVWAVDANRLFSRCTPQAVTRGVEVLAGIVHPGAAPQPAQGEARRVSL